MVHGPVTVSYLEVAQVMQWIGAGGTCAAAVSLRVLFTGKFSVEGESKPLGPGDCQLRLRLPLSTAAAFDSSCRPLSTTFKFEVPVRGEAGQQPGVRVRREPSLTQATFRVNCQSKFKIRATADRPTFSEHTPV